MIKIRCIAVDDEPPALRQMEEYIRQVPYLDLLGSFSNPMDTLGFLKENKVDLIFLDIQMEQFTGLELLKLLKNQPKIILTTAYDSYALQAFDLEVDDYLLKPISFDRFCKATERIYNDLNLVSQMKSGNVTINSDELDYIFIRTKSRIQRLDLNDILYIEGLKEYLIINTLSERIITLMTFNQILKKLPEKKFQRVHKSYIVALKKIEIIRKSSILIGEKVIPIGASFRDNFLKLIET
ncbi:MAG: response regulator transcription factor [Bacteroidetes bacterium]|jgi:two-component system, LytTR family, response regulator|nr:response regulator transcription factor [Bacteroidota bacterium]MBT4402030.1 response regulator transcription factor [Bacteroidota bacterium]MBT4411733.1 response regulator transcription factor [Bacteroidota bacterium]MBT7462804.1 response regulator transcription factor [Bacteroidota bacterium]